MIKKILVGLSLILLIEVIFTFVSGYPILDWLMYPLFVFWIIFLGIYGWQRRGSERPLVKWLLLMVLAVLFLPSILFLIFGDR